MKNMLINSPQFPQISSECHIIPHQKTVPSVSDWIVPSLSSIKEVKATAILQFVTRDNNQEVDLRTEFLQPSHPSQPPVMPICL